MSSNLQKALITGITEQDGSYLTESLLSTGYAGQSTAAPGPDADLELAGLQAPGAGRCILAERFGDWHRWDEQVTSMEQVH